MQPRGRPTVAGVTSRRAGSDAPSRAYAPGRDARVDVSPAVGDEEGRCGFRLGARFRVMAQLAAIEHRRICERDTLARSPLALLVNMVAVSRTGMATSISLFAFARMWLLSARMPGGPELATMRSTSRSESSRRRSARR
jgi:hypothetical protein